ncbi:phospholipase domain-containing protein [Streptomyces sp. NPDC054933]
MRTWSSTTKGHPEATVSIAPSSPQQLTLTVTNSGHTAVVFTIGGNAADGGASGSTATVQPGGSQSITLGVASDGGYDYTVTADTGDGFARRFAGRTYPSA